MKMNYFILYILLTFCFLFGNAAQQKQVPDDVMLKMMQKIYSETIKYKKSIQSAVRDREELLSNLSSTAPMSPFLVNADLDVSLLEGNPEALIYLSTDNQQSWESASAVPINSEGYENTWESSIINSGENSVAWYVEGQVDSDILGFDFGRVYVTQSPKYDGFDWNPSDNYFKKLLDEDAGDAPSSQDIIEIKGTYKDDRLYSKMSLSSGCCDEGGLFGPWYLYGVGFFNPDSESESVYALGYGSGGFGQLTPGLLKLTGDINTGEISGFEYITTNINYVTSGNDLFLSCLMSYFLDDPEFGPWPNSLGGGIAVVGVTVEASLDGLDVAADVLDQTNPGVHILSTQFQDGNFPSILSNPNYNSENNILSVDYLDSDGNLPWLKELTVSGSSFNMIPDSHNYLEGVTYSTDLSSLPPGEYVGTLSFSDSNDNNNLEISFAVGEGGGGLSGDINDDGVVNVLDVVLLVNMILSPGNETDSADLNNDGMVNVLDVVLLVNIILSP